MNIFDQVQFGEPRVPRTKKEVIEHNFEAVRINVKTHKIFELNSQAASHLNSDDIRVRYIVNVSNGRPVIVLYTPTSENDEGKELSNNYTFRNKSLADRIGVPATPGTELYYRLTPVNSMSATAPNGVDQVNIDLSAYTAFEISEQISAPVKEDNVNKDVSNASSALA